MPTAYAIFEEEGEYEDHSKELLAIALSEEAARAEVKRQAEAFVEKRKPYTPHSTPIEVLGSVPHLTVRIGKMGWGPRDVEFYAEEVPLADSV